VETNRTLIRSNAGWFAAKPQDLRQFVSGGLHECQITLIAADGAFVWVRTHVELAMKPLLCILDDQRRLRGRSLDPECVSSARCEAHRRIFQALRARRFGRLMSWAARSGLDFLRGGDHVFGGG